MTDVHIFQILHVNCAVGSKTNGDFVFKGTFHACSTAMIILPTPSKMVVWFYLNANYFD